MNAVAAQIQIGRRVIHHGAYGTPGVHRDECAGPMIFINPNACAFDVVTFDGYRFESRESCIDRPGIGCVDLLDKVHGPAMIERAHHLVAERTAADQLAAITAREDFEAAEAARVITDAPAFYWNGIKDAKGEKLQKAWYSTGPYTERSGLAAATITITARDYARFSDKVRACFAVTNDSDSMTDYFDNDRIRVLPVHPLYALVKAACDAQQAHHAKRARGQA